MAGFSLLQKPFLRQLLRWLFPLTALLFLTSAPMDPPARYTLALMIWMLGWWIFELAPIAVTALLPLIFLPLADVLPLKAVAAAYGDPVIFLFFSGFILAIALEKHGLHLLFSSFLLHHFARSAGSIVLIVMVTTAFLSMWISNTATAVMMLPIGLAVMKSFLEQHPTADPQDCRRFATCMVLGIAHSANIGGATTLIGTPPNVVMAGYMQELLQYELGFASWLFFALPIGIFVLLCSWYLMTHFLFPFRFPAGHAVFSVKAEQVKLNQLQKLIVVVFSLTALCWIFKNQLENISGIRLHDAQIGLAAAVFLFLLTDKKGETALRWQDTRDLPWGILLLFGGGIALANGMETAGILEAIGTFMQQLESMPMLLFIIILTATAIFMSEVMSNVALATVMLPIVIGIGKGLDLPPMLLVAPVTLATTFAFMLPIGTPPNAIVYGSGQVSQQAMIRAGWWMNLISIGVISLVSYVWFRH